MVTDSLLVSDILLLVAVKGRQWSLREAPKVRGIQNYPYHRPGRTTR